MITTRLTLLMSAFFTLSACGGGGSGSAPASVTPPTVDPVAYQSGVFKPSSDYEAFCQAVRTGTNPDTNQPYADKAGSVAYENHWLRSFSDETYLWYDEIPDQDPTSFNSTLAYFDTLKTTATTPSGNSQDRFHSAIDTEEWLQLIQGGVSAGYGAQFVIVERATPRKLQIAYVEPNTPASVAGLQRGDEVIEVDGVDLVNTNINSEIDTLNAGLFPSAINEAHQFRVVSVAGGASRLVNISSDTITTTPVQNTKIVSHAGKQVGYILFNDHIATAEAGLVQAINALAGVDELVLDLRYNGGGYLAIAAQLAHMIAGSAANSQTFETTVFNDKHPTTNPFTGNPIQPVPFIDETVGLSLNAGQSLPSLNLSRLIILSGGTTCSASEAIINGLRGINFDVVLIGAQTCGKPYGFYGIDNCGTTYLTINFRGENAQGFGDYADGFIPADAPVNLGESVQGCSIADDFSKPLGDVQEARFAAALSWIEDGQCPSSGGSPKAQGITSEPIAIKPLWLQQRIYQ